jgi:hypothetical protein
VVTIDDEVGVGVVVGVAVGVGVAVAAGVGVAVTTGVGVAVTTGVAVAVALAVAIGVGVAVTPGSRGARMLSPLLQPERSMPDAKTTSRCNGFFIRILRRQPRNGAISQP